MKTTPTSVCCSTSALQKAEEEIRIERENAKFFRSLGMPYITRERFYELERRKKR